MSGRDVASSQNVFLVQDLIHRSASIHPDGEALKYKGQALSYGQLGDQIRNAAAGLSSLGVNRGDRIAIFLEKRIEAVVAQFAAAELGAIFVPINPVLKPRQFAHILRTSEARVLVTSQMRLHSIQAGQVETSALDLILLVDDVITMEGHSWSQLIDQNTTAQRSTNIIDADAAAILFTSGSTGPPKGVVLTHRNLVAAALSASEHIGNMPSDRLLCVLPLSFDYGIVQLTSAFNVGGTAVLHNYLLPQDVIREITTEEITGLAGVPPLWIQLSRLDWTPEVARKLRYVTSSGGTMPKAVLHRLQQMLPTTDFHLMYGLTEAFRSTALPPDQVSYRPGSIGKPLPNADVLVVRDDGQECQAGEIGELVHRGAFVTDGYWNNPEESRLRYRPPPAPVSKHRSSEIAIWSGDYVRRDQDGYFYFIGRRDEQIKCSGYRVSPTEVEEIIYETGLVDEVVAFGIPHPRLGQAIVAVCRPRCGAGLDTKAILRQCRRDMPEYMVPQLLIERTVIPRTPNGKLDRAGIASAFQDTLLEAAG